MPRLSSCVCSISPLYPRPQRTMTSRSTRVFPGPLYIYPVTVFTRITIPRISTYFRISYIISLRINRSKVQHQCILRVIMLDICTLLPYLCRCLEIYAIVPILPSKISFSTIPLSHHLLPSCANILVAASPNSINRSLADSASVWKTCCSGPT